jgi:hypothetical protein
MKVIKSVNNHGQTSLEAEAGDVIIKSCKVHDLNNVTNLSHVTRQTVLFTQSQSNYNIMEIHANYTFGSQ